MKNIICIALVILTSFTIKAQKLTIGTETGLISSIKSVNHQLLGSFDLENRRYTFYAGINSTYRFNKHLALTSGVHYLKQGKQFNFSIENEETKAIEKLDYIIIPAALNIFLGKPKKIFTTLGIYNGINVNAMLEDKNISHETQKYVFGALLGIGYQFYKTEKFNLNSSIKYYRGINNILITDPNVFYLDYQKRYESLLISFNLNYHL